MALVMALAIMLVLTLALTAVVQFSASNSRNSSRSNAGEKAYAFAEAGVNAGASVLAVESDPTTWSTHPTAASPSSVSYAGGTVNWWAAPPVTCGTDCYRWTISARSFVRNPTGPGTAAVSRIVSKQFQVDKTAGSGGFGKSFLYSKGDITLSGGSATQEALISEGNIVLSGSGASIDVAATAISARGTIDAGNSQDFIGDGLETTLTIAMTTTADYATVASVTDFPSTGWIKIYNEYMTYTATGTTAAACAVSRTTLGVTGLTNIATTATVADTTALPTSGTILIDSEQITYTGKTATTLTGLGRHANGTLAAPHSSGATVKQVVTPPCFTGLTRGAFGSIAAAHSTTSPDSIVSGAPAPTLTAAMDATQTVARVTSTTGFRSSIPSGAPAAGTVMIANASGGSVEYIPYTGIGTTSAACGGTPPCFTGLTRGYIPGFPAATHSAGASVEGRLKEVHTIGGCVNNCSQINSVAPIDANLIQDSAAFQSSMPVFDVAAARAGAAPGPAHVPPVTNPSPAPNCTISFAGGASGYYSASQIDIAPATTDYTCLASGAYGAGELSWNHLTRVLRVRGVVFLPADVKATEDILFDAPQPGATIYIAGKYNSPAGGDFCGLRSTTTLTSSISAGQSTPIFVASTLGFPDPTFYKGNFGYVKIDNEEIKYGDWTRDDPATGGNESSLTTIQRGRNGTTAAAHSAGATVTETAACDFTNWDPNTGNNLALLGPNLPVGVTNTNHDFTFSGGAVFQGLVYTDGKLTVSGGGVLSGTAFANVIDYSGGAAAPAPGILSVPFGFPAPTSYSVSYVEGSSSG
jgi:hypothetical protein